MKVPKIILVLVLGFVLVASLLVSCESELMPQEDIDQIATVGLLSTLMPAVIIMENLEVDDSIEVDDFEGLTLDLSASKFTWNNFDVAKAAAVIDSFVGEAGAATNEPPGVFLNVFSEFEEGRVIVVSGTTTFADNAGVVSFFGSIKLKIDSAGIDEFENLKGLYDINYEIELAGSDDITLSITVNNREATVPLD